MFASIATGLLFVHSTNEILPCIQEWRSVLISMAVEEAVDDYRLKI